MAYARHNSLRAPNARTIFDWFTGTGFLSVDAGAFFVALMVLLPWNLYRSPGDLWVAQPLRTWAFLLTFHALVVGAIALARGIVRSSEPEVESPRVELRASSDWSSPRVQRTDQHTASTLLAQEWARRWLDEDRTEAAELIRQSDDRPPRHSRETVDPVTSSRAFVTPWPDAPEPRRSIDAEAILADWLDEQASEYITPVSHEVDPLRAVAQAQASNAEVEENGALDPELEWKWVEAAASAWLSKHDLTSISPSDNASSHDHA